MDNSCAIDSSEADDLGDLTTIRLDQALMARGWAESAASGTPAAASGAPQAPPAMDASPWAGAVDASPAEPQFTGPSPQDTAFIAAARPAYAVPDAARSAASEKLFYSPALPAPMPWVKVRQQAEALSLAERLNRMRGEVRQTEAASAAKPQTADSGIVRVSREEAEKDFLMKETAKHLRSIGRVNILVAGQTGVGKSTLINSVFGESFANTAAGRPVTQHAEWYSSSTVPLRILDTKGLEAKDYERTLRGIRTEIEKGRAATDTKSQLHIGWVCVSTPSSRVQDCEVDIVRMLNRYDIPAIVVLTKDDEDPNFADIVACIMAEQRAYCRAIVPVRALARRSTPALGLDSLVMATYRALPDAHRSAFAAAQKINRDLNRKAAEDYVNAAALAAAASAVIPIPLVDLATLAPIQAGMMLGVASAFGLSLDRQQITQVITTTLGSLAASFAGKWAVGNVLKFIPGAGSVMGAALNATVAGAVTRGMGTAFIRFLYRFMERNNRTPSAAEILDTFPAYYKTGEA